MNQREATYQAICNVTGHKGDKAVEITTEQRKQVIMVLCEGFRKGTIELATQYPDDKELRKYVNGLVSNWIRKDTRLNGGIKYQPKNPGSRAGSGDAQLANLRKLHSTLTSEVDKAEVQGYIDARVAQLKVPKQVTIDFSALPADLQAKFSK